VSKVFFFMVEWSAVTKEIHSFYWLFSNDTVGRSITKIINTK
jgi:hypothetical protein